VKLVGADHSGLVIFDAQLKRGWVRAEYPNTGAVGLEIQIDGVEKEEILVRSREPIVIRDVEQESALGPVRQVLLDLDIQSILIVPIVKNSHVIGSFSLDAIGHKYDFTEEELEICKIFATQVAVAVEHAHLYEEIRHQAKQLEALRRTTLAITSQLDRKELLRTIIKQAARLLQARSGGLYEYYPERKELTIIADYNRSDHIGKTIKVGEGMAGRLVQGSEPYMIVDDYDQWSGRSPIYAEGRPFGAVLEVPLRLHNNIIGVLYLDDIVGRKFITSDAYLLGLFADQAAVAYDNARRMDSLVQMRRTAETLARAPGVHEVLDQIAKSARISLQADSTAIWPYDAVRNRFISESFVADNISPSILSEFTKWGPRPDGTAHTVMKVGWIEVADVADVNRYGFLGGTTRSLLEKIGVRSFWGISLAVGDEILGVLYINHNRIRDLNEEEKQTAFTFANHAALALKKARLLEQVTNAKKAAEAVARVTVLGNRADTLASIVEETQKALNCSAVVLFEYDKTEQKLLHPPTMAGVRHPVLATQQNVVDPQSIVYEILEMNDPCIVEQVRSHALFGNRRFALDEDIKSVVAVPLHSMNQKVGVLFVNYRALHNFTPDELSNIKLFSYQAAVAIRNAQLFEERTHQIIKQDLQVKLSKQLLGTVTLRETLENSVGFAAEALGTEYCDIVLPSGDGGLIFSAAVGWEQEMVGTYRVGADNKSQTGYTIQTRTPVKVDDYSKENRFEVPSIVLEHKIQSGLSVPMFKGGSVVGAMLVHTTRERHFSDDDVSHLSLIANETAIAVERAQEYDARTRKTSYLNALYESSKAITASFGLERKKVLDEIVRQAVESIRGVKEHGAILGTLELLDEKKNELVFETIYTPEPEKHPELSKLLGLKLPLDKEKAPGGRVGVNGRAVLSKTPQLVLDVTQDDDYVEYPDYTGHTKAEVSAPLIDGDRVLGVINVESDKIAGFDNEDLDSLKALADLAVIVIKNAAQYEELDQTKSRVGALTALTWMSMVNNYYQHTNVGNASNIDNIITLIRTASTQKSHGEKLPMWVEEYLDNIASHTQNIKHQPITPPLSSEEGVRDIAINALICERLGQLWENQPYCLVSLIEKPVPSERAMVRISPEWLRRALDILIDNAVQESLQVEQARRMVSVTTRTEEGGVELIVTDRGRGFPAEVRDKVFKGRVEKPADSGGLGMGLLMAVAIVETYGGRVSIKQTGSEGTSMMIWLPLAEQP
jgi:GAF domain-containing protein